MSEFKEKKRLLEAELEKINADIRNEDIKKMSKKDLLEFTKINLEIQKNLAILQAAEDAEII